MALKNKIGIFFLIFVFLSFCIFYGLAFGNLKNKEIKIFLGQHPFYVEVASTENARSKGLSGVESLKLDAGMLFIFEESGQKAFWMKDMNFDLDIIWLDENKKIIGFVENASRNSYNLKIPNLSKIYYSPKNTKYVLEINAGTINKLKIKIGSTSSFHLFQ